MKKTLALVCAVLFLIGAGGCLFDPVFILTADPSSGRPSLEAGGLMVHFTVTGGPGTYEADFGDGSLLVDVPSTFTHLYTHAGTATASVRWGDRTASAVVTVLDSPPTAFEPFWSHCQPAHLGEKITFNSNYGYSGCDPATGRAVMVYGVEDFDGDPVRVRYYCNRADTGAPESIFDDRIANGVRTYARVNGLWLDLGLVTYFAGWTGNQPPYPYTEPFGIPNGIEPESPTYTVQFTIEAQDIWGAMASVHWTIEVVTGCSE